MDERQRNARRQFPGTDWRSDKTEEREMKCQRSDKKRLRVESLEKREVLTGGMAGALAASSALDVGAVLALNTSPVNVSAHAALNAALVANGLHPLGLGTTAEFNAGLKAAGLNTALLAPHAAFNAALSGLNASALVDTGFNTNVRLAN